jgi:hypothetical protein
MVDELSQPARKAQEYWLIPLDSCHGPAVSVAVQSLATVRPAR